MSEMNKQYEVLDTFTHDKDLGWCQQSFTNTHGVIFLLEFDGKVYCFDVFGEKKLTKIQNLTQD